MLTPDGTNDGGVGTEDPKVTDPQAGQPAGEATGQPEGTQPDAGGEVTRPKWMDMLSDEHKNNEALYQYQEGPGEVINRLLELEGTAGGVKPLGDNPSEEEVKAFREAFRIPESTEGYEIDRPEIADLPKGMKYDEELEQNFLKMAHDTNLTSGQVNNVLKFHNEVTAKTLEAQQTRLKETEANVSKP